MTTEVNVRVTPRDDYFVLTVKGYGETVATTTTEVIDVVVDFVMSDVDVINVEWDDVAGRLCCELMVNQICRTCDIHLDTAECEQQLIVRDFNGRFGLRFHDSGTALVTIYYCPWCGANLKERWDASA